MKIENLYLKVEATPGTSIDTACSEAISLSAILDMRVELSFNGEKVIVQRNSAVSMLVARYYEGLKRRLELEQKKEVEDVETLQAVVDVLSDRLQKIKVMLEKVDIFVNHAILDYKLNSLDTKDALCDTSSQLKHVIKEIGDPK